MNGKTILIMVTAIVALAIGLMALTSHAPREVSLLEGQETQPRTELTEEDIRRHIAGSNTFAWELYHVLAEEEGNLFFSPYSVSLSLGMAHCGGRGETFEEMRRTLHFSLPPTPLSYAVAELDGLLREGNGLDVANSLWAQQGHPFDQSFRALLQEGYGVEPQVVDFAGSPDNARKKINAWAEDQTAGKIDTLIPPDGVDPTTRLVLASAIYFSDSWEHCFQSLPRPVKFHLLNGETAEVPMMSLTAPLTWMRSDNFHALSLPYVGETSMLILLPDQGVFHEFQTSVSAEKLTSILHSLEEETISVIMPMFEYASGFQLRETLKRLGMNTAFTSTANFSGMSEGRLQIAEVFHKAFVYVDEQGTEAAAATATTMSRGLAKNVSINIDRPFIFLIRHEPTGTILFMGRVINPEWEGS